MSFKSDKNNELYLKVSEGNKKLRPSKDLKYLIFNIPAIITCPGATEHCKNLCYAIKAERQYPNCKKARDFNLKAAMSADFVAKMIFTIQANLNRPGYKKAKKVVIRVHESGDFFSQKYFDMWLEIANYFLDDKRIVFMAYTKSVDYVAAMKNDIPENLVIRFSLWDDTKPAEYEKAVALGLPVYTAVDKFTNEPKKNRCSCENCTTCNKCWSAISMLMCEIH